MKDQRFYDFLRKQIPIMVGLSLLPGLGYILLGWLHNIHAPALLWYALVVVTSIWGGRLYRNYNFAQMSHTQLQRWYGQLTGFFYLFFLLWTLIFLIYIWHDEHKLHYVAIFTQIGASVVASALLSSDRRLYIPTIYILMVPLIIYFFSIGEWFSYVLTVFGGIFTWVLMYAAHSSNQLLQKTSFQASHDQLTGLHNRHYFIESLQQFMNSLRERNHYSYLLLIDLDHFKSINDSLGHDVGDELLREVADRLRRHTHAGNITARLGGDEFIIIGNDFARNDECQSAATTLSETLLNSLKAVYLIGDHHLYISCSIGISLITPSSHTATRFIREADIAMYEVKAGGRDGLFIFNEELAARVERNMEVEQRLRLAVENRELSLHFQPQMDGSGKIVGAEALARWDNPQLGSVPPAQFISIAEQTGQIVELGNFILESAFASLRRWHDKGMALEQLSVNISMRQFMHQNFIPQVRRLSEQYLNAELLKHVVFEVTESLVAEDIRRIIHIMEELHQDGIRFSMDDFGTGYSSLSYLKQLPIDEIKIDRSFVSKLGHDEEEQAMLTTILKMAHIFGLNIVAEGVEEEHQWHYLHQRGCDLFQGYLFARPLPENEFETFYQEHQTSTC